MDATRSGRNREAKRGGEAKRVPKGRNGRRSGRANGAPVSALAKLEALPAAAQEPESFDLQPAPDGDTSRANSVALARMASEVNRANDRLHAELTRSRERDALLAQREAELRDLASKLAEIAVTASTDRVARRKAERLVDVVAASRGYRIGLRVHRVRLRAKRAARTIVTGPRAICRRLVAKLRWQGKPPDRTRP